MKKTYLYVLGALGIAIVAVLAFYLLAGKSTAPGSDVKPGQTQVRGAIVCLPHKGSGPQTLECALGLKDAGGKYYAVQDENMEMTKFQMGTVVVVTGTQSSPKPDEKYDIVANIEASSVKEPH